MAMGTISSNFAIISKIFCTLYLFTYKQTILSDLELLFMVDMVLPIHLKDSFCNTFYSLLKVQVFSLIILIFVCNIVLKIKACQFYISVRVSFRIF